LFYKVQKIYDVIEMSDKILNIIFISKDEYVLLPNVYEDNTYSFYNFDKEIILNESLIRISKNVLDEKL